MHWERDPCSDSREVLSNAVLDARMRRQKSLVLVKGFSWNQVVNILQQTRNVNKQWRSRSSIRV